MQLKSNYIEFLSRVRCSCYIYIVPDRLGCNLRSINCIPSVQSNFTFSNLTIYWSISPNEHDFSEISKKKCKFNLCYLIESIGNHFSIFHISQESVKCAETTRPINISESKNYPLPALPRIQQLI